MQPERFVDAEDARRDSRRQPAAADSRATSKTLASRHLGDGQVLNIEVLDVDLAGEVRFDRRRMDRTCACCAGVADWPRITLRYTLETAGEPARRVEQVTVYDMAYLQRLNRYGGDEPLRYEKPMLDEWFDAQFGSAAAK